MIHHSKNCATLSIVQDKGCCSDLFTSNKELVLKLKRLDFLSNQSWAAHKGCLLRLGEQLSRITVTKMDEEAGICNETESCELEKVLWSVVIDLCASRKC